MDVENKLLLKAFPSSLKEDVLQVLKIIPSGSIHSNKFTINVNNESIIIPSRIYFEEPSFSKENSLTKKQKDILHCIYTRHHNGYIREKRLKQLVNSNNNWISPYVIKLLSEYIVQILFVIEKIDSKIYIDFIKDNLEFWNLTKCRVVSYWGEYYNFKFPKLKEYVGYKLIERIDLELKKQNENKN